MKALVVESSDTMRAVLSRILFLRGFEVDEASDIRPASDPIHSIDDDLDLVLVEWSLNETDSLEFVTRLRRGGARYATVVMLTGVEPGARDLHGALIAGADDYLVKPFSSNDIDEKLASVGFGGKSDRGSDRMGPPCR